MMRTLPGQSEDQLPKGNGVFLSVDVLRLPQLWHPEDKGKDLPVQRKCKDCQEEDKMISRKEISPLITASPIRGSPAKILQRDPKKDSVSDKWSEFYIRKIQRALRDLDLYKGETSGKIDVHTITGLNMVLAKDSWKNLDQVVVLEILRSGYAGELMESPILHPEKAPKPEMPDCDLGKKEHLLKVEEHPEQSRCIQENDPVLKDHYIDNNVSQFSAKLLPETNMFNIDHDRIEHYVVVYKDGKELDFSPDDLPKYSVVKATHEHVMLWFDYILKNDGLIYPERNGSITFSTASVPYLTQLNSELHTSVDNFIAEMRKNGQLMTTTAAFAADIAALGNMLQFNKTWVEHFSVSYKVRSGQQLELELQPEHLAPLKAKKVPDAFKEITERMNSLLRDKELRAELFEKLIPQMKNLDKTWSADRVTTTDKSVMFLGTKGFALVIDNDGRLFRGMIGSKTDFTIKSRTITYKGIPMNNEYTAEYAPNYSSMKEITPQPAGSQE
jgi:hypothetical protein